ncbi:MAG: hypothetical protein ACOVNR_05210 [Chitinophagaceae bacterium]
MNKLNKFYILFLGVVVVIASCKKADTPNDENEHEAINKMELTLTGGGNSLSFIAEDPDGDGGNPPSRIDTLKLQRGVTYSGSLQLYNIASTTVKNLTPKIIEQGKSHEVFYLPNVLNFTVIKNDRDANNFPLGFQTTWNVPNAGLGSVTIKLMHKTAIKGPNDAPTVGHSDLEITMPVKIQ